MQLKTMVLFMFFSFFSLNTKAEIIKLLCIQDVNKDVHSVYLIDTINMTVNGDAAEIGPNSFSWRVVRNGGWKFISSINRVTGKFSGHYATPEGKVGDLLTSTCNIAPGNKF